MWFVLSTCINDAPRNGNAHAVADHCIIALMIIDDCDSACSVYHVELWLPYDNRKMFWFSSSIDKKGDCHPVFVLLSTFAFSLAWSFLSLCLEEPSRSSPSRQGSRCPLPHNPWEFQAVFPSMTCQHQLKRQQIHQQSISAWCCSWSSIDAANHLMP